MRRATGFVGLVLEVVVPVVVRVVVFKTGNRSGQSSFRLEKKVSAASGLISFA